MNSEIENIYSAFINELSVITKDNGYNHDIGTNIFRKNIDPADYPVTIVTLDNETTIERNEDDSVFTREAILKLTVHFQTPADVLNEGLVSGEQLKWRWDIKRYVSGHSSVRRSFNSNQISSIKHIWTDICVPDIDYKNNTGAVTVLIKVRYIEEFI